MNGKQMFVLTVAIHLLVLPLHTESTLSVARSAVSSVARAGILLPALGTKKAILLAPIVLPMAAVAKVKAVATIAGGAAVGAAIGAPLGAIIGAKAGAIKGAAVGKAIIGAKVVMGAKIAAKAAALAVGAKAKAVAFGVALMGKKAHFIGKGALAAGKGLTAVGVHFQQKSQTVKGLGSSMVTTLKAGIPSLLPSIPSLASLPFIPAMPDVQSLGAEGKPKIFDANYMVDTPLTGVQHGKATFVSSRRKRNANPEPQSQAPSQNVNQLLAFVQSNNAQHCLARVVCELSANPTAHGNDGVRFGRALLTLSRINHPQTAEYRSASTFGSRARNPNVCFQQFPTCALQSNEVVRLGNAMLRV